jgi:2-C-methyl-D-erythritol 4-phosphate cytidylyltransferase
MDASATTIRASALVVAAGGSTRLGDGPRKPLLEFGGRTVLEHACAAFETLACVGEIVVVAHAADLERVRALARSSPVLRKVRAVVAGGEQRSDSVRAGLASVTREAEVVAVHDAARPLLEPSVAAAALELAAREGAALVAVPVVDTIKRSHDGRRAAETLDRSSLWAAQTPQVFRRELLARLLERAEHEGFAPTDEAALHERYVGPIPLVRGARANLKLTTPDDLPVFDALLRARAAEASP